MSEELRPCPFCGSEAQVNTWTMHGITESRCFCPNSDCPNSVRTVALATWNTRPIEDELRARIAELEHDLTNKEIEYTDLWDDALALQSRIAELEDAQRWIPVSERLPEEDTDGNTLMAICRHSGEWVRAPFGAEFADEFVRHYTHWMYAPQPPEVQE